MLKYKKGDLIEAAKFGEVNIIAHQCNCFNNMGAGIAPQIKKAVICDTGSPVWVYYDVEEV